MRDRGRGDRNRRAAGGRGCIGARGPAPSWPRGQAHRVLRSASAACVLGHTRLRIIDLYGRADQPLANEDGTVWVNFNGGLYNFPELRAELEAAGHRFANATDTEVLVQLYEDCNGGPDRMLARLRGMFAFALFDTSRGRLLIARDRLALSGVGGDELFGGYPSFRQVPLVERVALILHLSPWLGRGVAARVSAGRWPRGRVSRTLTTQPGIGAAYRAVRGLFDLGDLERLGVLPWIGEHDILRRFSPGDPPDGDTADRVASLELARYLRDQLLRDTDQMSMAHSLEVRVPLVDDRVVEVALATPASVRNPPQKALLRRAAGAHSVRPRLGFTLPFEAWMRGALREAVREGLLSEELPLGWLTTASGRAELWRAFEERRVHWSRPRAIAALRRWASLHGLRW